MKSIKNRVMVMLLLVVVFISGILCASPALATEYGKVAIVAASGGDYTDPVAAMNDIATWCPDPASNRCLLKIMPGTYDIGTSTINMFTDIEGSGEGVTIIQGKGAPNQYSGYYAVIHQATGTELRSLTVENKDGQNAPMGIGIQLYALQRPVKIKDVTVVITNPTHTPGHAAAGIVADGVEVELFNVKVKGTGGTAIGIANVVNTAVLNNVTATVTGWGTGTGQCQGIGINGGNVKIRNSEISVSNCYTYYGINGYSSNVTITDTKIDSPQVGVQSSLNSVFKIDRSSIYGGTTSIYHPFAVYVATSMLSGGATSGSGTIKCTGVYDGNYDPAVCP